MTTSLQDQLLSAGLIDKKKAKSISKESRKVKKQKIRDKDQSLTPAQEAAQQAKKEKLARDVELNRQRDLAAEKKAITAQVIQLINHYKLDRKRGEHHYNFSDGAVIKKIMITVAMSDEIASGRLCIARAADKYEVIPKPIADKIIERQHDAIIVYNAKSDKAGAEISASDEGYYAQFEIPDDLVW